MRVNKKISLCILSSMAISTNLNAQVGKDSVLLEEVQVVGKSMARRMQEQAYAISVLDLKKQYQTAAPLNKLLNSVTSVKIREDGGLGSNYSFSLNGFSGNQVKFFKGDIVWAALRFSCRDYNGNTYQDITVQDIVSFSKH